MERMARPVPRHDRDAGGPADVLAAKAALRQEVWSAMRAAKVARFPGAVSRIPNFAGAEAAAERLRAMPVWRAAGTLKGRGRWVMRACCPRWCGRRAGPGRQHDGQHLGAAVLELPLPEAVGSDPAMLQPRSRAGTEGHLASRNCSAGEKLP